MSTARPTLAAEHREVTGKHVARLRQDGRCRPSSTATASARANVTVDAHEFDLLRRHTGPNALVDLSVDGKKAQPVLVHSVQVHPVNRRPLHVDLFARPDDRGADRRRPARADRRVARGRAARRHAPAPDRDGPRPGPAGPPARSRSSTRSSRSSTSTRRSTSATSTIPGDVTLLTDGDEVIAKVLPPRVEVEEVPVAPRARGPRARLPRARAPRVPAPRAAPAARGGPTRASQPSPVDQPSERIPVA